MDIWITDMEAQLLNEDIGKVDSTVLSNNRTCLVRHVTKIVCLFRISRVSKTFRRNMV